MFIELIDLLRCTRAHEDSWLVAAFHEMRERNVVEGVLSCPVCQARYPVTQGIAWFDVEPGTTSEARPTPDAVPAAADSAGLLVAAYLNLVEPGIVVLEGGWGDAAEVIARLGSRVITLDSAGSGSGEAVSRVRADGIVPLARECLDGIALDSAEPRLVASAARALRTGGRMVAPVTAEVPDGIAELARDERYFVGVKEGSESGLVRIGKR